MTNLDPMGAELIFELFCIVAASPQRVFEVMTDPEQVAQWWGPEWFTCPEVILDARVGGAYRIAMQPPEGELFHVTGEYLEVQPSTLPDLHVSLGAARPRRPRDGGPPGTARGRRRNRGGDHPRPVRYRGATRAAQGRVDRHPRPPSQPSRTRVTAAGPVPTMKPVTATDAHAQQHPQWPIKTQRSAGVDVLAGHCRIHQHRCRAVSVR
jgi:hypothetical protein